MSKRKCLVCLKKFDSNFAVKKHYDKTKCGPIRQHKRFSHFKSSKAIECAIQEWKKTGRVPKNPRNGVMKQLPTRRTRKVVTPDDVQVNYCPNCGSDLRRFFK